MTTDSILIDYLDQNYYNYRDDYERQLMVIHALHHLLETEDSQLRDNQVNINLFVEQMEFERAVNHLNEEILIS